MASFPRVILLATLAALTLQCGPGTRTTPVAVALRDGPVVVISLDGVRSEEFFQGAYSFYGYNEPERSRAELFPFLWKDLAKRNKTLILGDRFSTQERCLINNQVGLSLPAYADLLSATRQYNVVNNRFRGRVAYPTIPDRLIALGLAPQRIALFASWKHIENVASQNPVPAFHVETGRIGTGEKPPWKDARYDADLMISIKRFLQNNPAPPRLLYIIFNDADEWGHLGHYENYLQAIRNQDGHVKDLFQTLESFDVFRGKTTYIITTDHGRGRGRYWRHHSWRIGGTQFIWAFIYSPRMSGEAGRIQMARNELQNHCSHLTIANYVYHLLAPPGSP